MRDRGIRGAGVLAAAAAVLAIAAGAAFASLGSLTFVQVKTNGVDGVSLFQAEATAVSSDGEDVYVRKAGGITAFSRDAGDGSLTQIDTETNVGGVDALPGPNGDIAVSPDGAYVYATSDDTDVLAVFTRNGDGTLTYLEHKTDGAGGVNLLNGAMGVAVSPDSSTVTVAAEIDDSVTVFQRQAGGTLTVLDTETDGAAGADGLNGAHGVAVSPDGEDVYVTSRQSDDDGIADFSRAGTGALSFNQFVPDVGVAGPSTNPSGVQVSPDGNNVYATTQLADSVVSFSRAGSGDLTQIDVDTNGAGGVSGIDGPFYLAVAGDGASVYVTGSQSNAFAGFNRNPGTGALTFIASYSGGGASLVHATGVAVSPDGKHVYASAILADATNVYSRELLAPANSVAPAVTGSVEKGGTLSCATGSWTGVPTPTLTREWLRNGVAVPGQTGPTYVSGDSDVGATVTCRVTATSAAGSANETSNGVSVVDTTPPGIAAAPQAHGKKPLTTKGVAVAAQCTDDCTVEATGVLKVPKAKGKPKGKAAVAAIPLRQIRLAPAPPVHLPFGGSTALTVGVTKPVIKRAQAVAFGKSSSRGRSLATSSKRGGKGAGGKPVTATVTVTVTATDSYSNRTKPPPTSIPVLIRPPTTSSSPPKRRAADLFASLF